MYTIGIVNGIFIYYIYKYFSYNYDHLIYLSIFTILSCIIFMSMLNGRIYDIIRKQDSEVIITIISIVILILLAIYTYLAKIGIVKSLF